jgi:hypothetical protein
LSGIADIRTYERQKTALDEFLADPIAAKKQLDEMILRTELFEAARVAAAAATADSRRAAEQATLAKAELVAAQEKLDATKREVDEAQRQVAASKADLSQRTQELIRADDAMNERARVAAEEMLKRERLVSQREHDIVALEDAAKGVRDEFERRMAAIMKAATG